MIPLTPRSMTLPQWHGAADRAIERMRVLREEKCPSCDGPDGDIGRDCTSRLDSDTQEHGFGDGPMCRWVPVEARKLEEQAHTRLRADRLLKAGCADKDALRLVPPGRVEPPLPPRAWFEESQEQRQAIEYAMEGARAFVGTDHLSLLIFSGATGTGKSMAAAWIVAAEQRSAFWFPATMMDSLEKWNACSARATSAPLLIVDDLGKEHVSDSGWSTEQMSNLITDRIDKAALGLRTIVTTNLSAVQLVKRYGDRFQSRMRKEECFFMPIGNYDLRAAEKRYRQRREFGRQS